MAFPFKVIEHVIPGQHIREYPQSVKGRQETPLQLAIKQYVPIDNDQSGPLPDNAVTLIGVPANGFPKELYEPLWEELYGQLKKQSVPLRGIWIADPSNQGASGVMNEDVQGDQTNWFDHSRDLLHMVNHFRDQIPRPVIGVAHSMGCAQLVHLSILHPRLLSTIILFDPVILDVAFGGLNPAKMASRRKDIWGSPEEAASSLQKFLRKWDPRVQQRYLRYALRPVPTRLYDPSKEPTIPQTAVTLTTTKHQEVWSYNIPNLQPESLDRLLLADWDTEKHRPYLFARPECWAAMRNLPFLRPSVFWAFGGKSYLSLPETQDTKMRVTGTGVGGNGGAAKGMVEKAVLPDGGHLLVFENLDWCASVTGDWISRWYQQWLDDENFWRGYKSRDSDAEVLRISEEAYKIAQMPMSAKRTEKVLVKGKI